MAAVRIPRHWSQLWLFILIINQSPVLMVIIIDINKNVSPNRLVSIVNMPALNDRWFM